MVGSSFSSIYCAHVSWTKKLKVYYVTRYLPVYHQNLPLKMKILVYMVPIPLMIFGWKCICLYFRSYQSALLSCYVHNLLWWNQSNLNNLYLIWNLITSSAGRQMPDQSLGMIFQDWNYIPTYYYQDTIMTYSETNKNLLKSCNHMPSKTCYHMTISSCSRLEYIILSGPLWQSQLWHVTARISTPLQPWQRW